jgi:hypothetical protein
VVTSRLWTFPVGYTCLRQRQQGLGGQEEGCHRRHPSFDVWERSPDHVHRKCLEDDAGVSRVVYRVDLVCWDRETSEVGSQHDRGMNAVMCQKDTPDSAVDCVVDRHDHYKGVIVTSGGEKGNCVL